MDRSDVFLSYRRKDVDFVKLVDQALKKSGREVWVDWEDIPPGVEGFADEIQKGIEGADAFIAVLSPSYLESEYCLMELREALRLKKRIVPIVYLKFEPAPPPEGIGHINWVYFTPHAGQENTFNDAFPKVIQALEADYEHAREHTRLLLRSLDWDKHQRNSSYLLRGAEIEKAEGWHVSGASKNPAPTELHGEFILLSRKQQLRQQQMFTGVIGVLLVLAAIAAVFAIFQATEAKRQENIAVTAQAEAVAAKDEAVVARDDAVQSAEIAHSNALASAALLPANQQIAVALALEATRSENAPPDVYDVLASVAYEPGSIRYLLALGGDPLGWTNYPAISADGQSIIVRDKLYDLSTGHLVRTFEDAPKLVLVAKFTPDGTKAVLAGDYGTIESTFESGIPDDAVFAGLYDVATGKRLQTYSTGNGVADIQLSSDGTTLATMTASGAAVLWDVDSGERKTEFVYNTEMSASFSPDMRWYAHLDYRVDDEGFNQGTNLIVTDVETKEDVVTTQVGKGTPLKFSSPPVFDSSSSEVTLNIDELATYSIYDGSLLMQYNNPQQTVNSIRYSPDGQSFLTASKTSRSVIQWNRWTGEMMSQQTAYERGPLLAEFVMDGKRVVSMDQNGDIMEWDLFAGNIENSTSPWTLLGISPDSKSLIYADGSDMVTLSIPDMTELNRVTSPEPQAVYIPDDPDQGKFMYGSTGTSDEPESTIYVGSLKTGKIEHQWNVENLVSVDKAQFTPDGQRLVMTYTAGENYTAHTELRDAATGELLQDFSKLGSIASWTLSPDGTHLLVSFVVYDAVGFPVGAFTLMLETDTGKTVFKLDEASDPAWFLPDGTQYLAFPPLDLAIPDDRHPVIHDVTTGAVVRDLPGMTQPPRSLLFFPDGKSFLIGLPEDVSGTLSMTASQMLLNNYNEVRQVVTRRDMTTGQIITTYPILPKHMALSLDGAFLATEDRSNLLLWRLDTPEQLIAWTCANRYVPEFTPEQREKYSIASETNVCARPSTSS